eukprot:8124589-Pyramimonas_sp.AAC.1
MRRISARRPRRNATPQMALKRTGDMGIDLVGAARPLNEAGRLAAPEAAARLRLPGGASPHPRRS